MPGASRSLCVLGLPRSNPGDTSPGAVYAIFQTAKAGARRLRVSEAERIRAGGRPLLTSIRKVLDARSGPVTFRHVRSHTGHADTHSRWNEVADGWANEWRRESPGCLQPIQWNEERLIVSIDGDYVHGDLRRWAQRAAARRRLLSWSKADGHVSRAIQGNLGAVQPLCELVRARGDAQQTLLLLEALCSRVPCGHRHARSRDHAAWPDEVWECVQCDEAGVETAEHILRCPATELVRRQQVLDAIRESVPAVRGVELVSGVRTGASCDGSWAAALRTALGLTWQVGTSSETRDVGFMKWSSWCPQDLRVGASGTGWELPWRGRFMLVHTPKRYARAAARRAVRATKSARPTRIVVICAGDMAPDDLEGAEWTASGHGETVAMFQNGMAETATPSRLLVPGKRCDCPPPDGDRKIGVGSSPRCRRGR